MFEALRPARSGFLRPFGCAWFIREFLLGHGPNGSRRIDPDVGTPQSDIFYHYKTALLRAIALDRVAKEEERQARREKRAIRPEEIERLSERYLARIPYKATGCRYHSFVVYFSNLQRLGWVELTGREEPSAFQDHYPTGPPGMPCLPNPRPSHRARLRLPRVRGWGHAVLVWGEIPEVCPSCGEGKLELITESACGECGQGEVEEREVIPCPYCDHIRLSKYEYHPCPNRPTQPGGMRPYREGVWTPGGEGKV